MNKILLFLLVAACSSCAKDHNKLAADLKFLSVEREGALSLYDIRFSSDMNIQDLYGRGEGVGQASTMLVCALERDDDFSVDHTIERSAYGLIEKKSSGNTAGEFSYVSSAFLSETLNKGTSRRNLSADELNAMLLSKKNIPCKVVVTAYGYKPYYSKTMSIPSADLLREVNKPTAN